MNVNIKEISKDLMSGVLILIRAESDFIDLVDELFPVIDSGSTSMHTDLSRDDFIQSWYELSKSEYVYGYIRCNESGYVSCGTYFGSPNSNYYIPDSPARLLDSYSGFDEMAESGFDITYMI